MHCGECGPTFRPVGGRRRPAATPGCGGVTGRERPTTPSPCLFPAVHFQPDRSVYSFPPLRFELGHETFTIGSETWSFCDAAQASRMFQSCGKVALWTSAIDFLGDSSSQKPFEQAARDPSAFLQSQ